MQAADDMPKHKIKKELNKYFVFKLIVTTGVEWSKAHLFQCDP